MNCVICLVCLLLISGCSSTQTEQKRPAKEVVIAKTVCKSVPYYIESVGNTKAYRTVDITPEVDGKITGFYFTDGGDVAKSDLLFTIESAPYLGELEEAEGQLEQAKASLSYQTQKVESYQGLLPDEYVSQLDFLQYVSQAESAKGQVEQFTGSVLKAKVNYDWCTIHSPIEGRCGKHQIDPGNVVHANQKEALVTINQISPLYTMFTVPERYLQQIRHYQNQSENGLEIVLRTLGDPKKTYTSSLDFIDNTVRKDTGTIQLRAIMENKDKALWPGMFLHISLNLYTIPNAVLVPESAIGKDTQGNFAFIAKKEGTVELRRVVIGQQHEENIVIEKGIAAGECVVSEGKSQLKPGDSYKVKK